MASLVERITGTKEKSATNAKERLKLVLIHDRTDISPATMDTIKDELLQVLTKYIEIDPSAVKIIITQDGRDQRLLADIPIKPTQKRRIG